MGYVRVEMVTRFGFRGRIGAAHGNVRPWIIGIPPKDNHLASSAFEVE
jgi:hypothetical protein